MHLDQDEAIRKLKAIEGVNLYELAKSYGIRPDNKGCIGLTIERVLGLAANTRSEADFGDWELKTIPIVSGRPKETMAINGIVMGDLIKQPFEESCLYEKLREMLVVFRTEGYTTSYIYGVTRFDLHSYIGFDTIKADYLFIQGAAQSGQKLASEMGTLIQPRTKGSANSSTRAYYGRIPFVADMLTTMESFSQPSSSNFSDRSDSWVLQSYRTACQNGVKGAVLRLLEKEIERRNLSVGTNLSLAFFG